MEFALLSLSDMRGLLPTLLFRLRCLLGMPWEDRVRRSLQLFVSFCWTFTTITIGSAGCSKASKPSKAGLGVEEVGEGAGGRGRERGITRE